MFKDASVSEITYSDRFISWGIQSFVFPVFIINFLNNTNRTKYFFRYLQIITLLGAASSILFFIFPVLDNWYLSVTKDPVFDIYKHFTIRYRAFGFSEHLNSTFSYVMGIFAGLSLFFSIKDLKHILFVIPYVVAIALNARTGFFPLILFTIYTPLIYIYKKNVKIFPVIILYFIIFLFMAPVIMSSMGSWVSAFFEELISIFTGNIEDTHTIKILFDQFFIPNNLSEFLFGTGESIYRGANRTSDIGIVLQIHYGGIFFYLLITFFVIYQYLRIIKKLGCTHWFGFIFITSYFIINFKGFYFASVPGSRLFGLLYVFYITEYHKSEISCNFGLSNH
ncbi:hypothetical protein [Spirochaeta dissipatitropha]